MSSANSGVQNNLTRLRNRLARLQAGEGPANRAALNREISNVQKQIRELESHRLWQTRARTPPSRKRARSRSSSRNVSPSRSPPNHMESLQTRINRLQTSLQRHFNMQYFPNRFSVNNHRKNSIMFPTPYSVYRAGRSLTMLIEEMETMRAGRRVRRRTSRAGSNGSVSSQNRVTRARSGNSVGSAPKRN
jgi:hypothetical protein